MNNFKNVLKELREGKGMSQVQLAKAVGWSTTAVHKWEKGTRMPTIDCVIELANYFNVTVGQLVGSEPL